MLLNTVREGGFLLLDLAERIERVHIKSEPFLVVSGELLLHPAGILGQEIHEVPIQGNLLFQLFGCCDGRSKELEKGFLGRTLIGNGLGGCVGGKVGIAIGVFGLPSALKELPVHGHPVHRIRTRGEMLPKQTVQSGRNGYLFRIMKRKGSEPFGMISPEAHPGQTLNNRQVVFECFQGGQFFG